jgi:hypothetical protein
VLQQSKVTHKVTRHYVTEATFTSLQRNTIYIHSYILCRIMRRTLVLSTCSTFWISRICFAAQKPTNICSYCMCYETASVASLLHLLHHATATIPIMRRTLALSTCSTSK